MVLGAAVVRAAFLGQPMRQDEADTVVLFGLTPVRHILVDTSIPNNHILHSLLVKGAIDAFGLGTAVVRLPAFVAGLLAVPLTWLVGRAFYSARAGLIAAALVSISTPMVLYATNARGYSLIAVATLTGLLALRSAVDRGGVRSWALFACAIAGGAVVSPSMLYPAGGMALWAMLELLAVRPVDRGRVRALVLSGAAAGAMTLVAYLPAIKVSGWRSVVANEYVRPLGWGTFIGRLPEFAGDFAGYLGAGWPLLLQLIVGLGVVAGWVMHRRVARDRWPVSLVALAWAVILLVAMRRAPFLRVWLFLVPLLALPAGAALDVLLSRLGSAAADVRVGVVAVLLALGMAGALVRQRATELITETGVFPDGQAVADSLVRMLAPGDVVAAQWRAQGPVDFYLRQRGVSARFVADGNRVSGRVFIIPARALDETPASVVRARRLANVDTDRAREVATFPTTSIWVVPPAGAPQ